MKRINIIVMSALALLVAVSCHKENQEVIEWKTELQAVKSSLIFLPGGGTETLEVNLSSVTVSSDKDWASASVSGNVISVTAAANPSKESRYAKLTIKSGSETITAAVIQYGEVLNGLELGDEVIPKEGKVLAYKYMANTDVKLSSTQDWIHFEMLDDEDEGTMVKVIVDPNPGLVRYATVSFTAGSRTGSAEFKQDPTWTRTTAGWDISVTDGVYDFPNQIDQVSVTPPDASTLYEFALLSKDDVKKEEEIAGNVKTFAESIEAEIRTKMASGAIEAPGDVLKSGAYAKQYENMPRSIWAVTMAFNERGDATGEFFYTDLQVPDRGPVKKAVDGWDVTISGGSYDYPNQTDEFTITPKAGYEDVKYIATVIPKGSVADLEDFAFTTFAMSTREEILAKVSSGELASFDAGLSSGVTTVSGENLAEGAVVVVVAFGNNRFYTGDYAAVEVEVPSRMPAMYRWLGKWNVSRKNSKYDDVDTWVITVKEKDQSLLIQGVESFTNPERYDVTATVDAEGNLIIKTQYTGAYEDSSRGHVDVLLSGQYDDTAAGKTYYTSSLDRVLITAKMSEDGMSADFEPGPINGYSFKNIQFYGRYKTSSGSTSAVTWNAGPTQIPQTITRVVE